MKRYSWRDYNPVSYKIWRDLSALRALPLRELPYRFPYSKSSLNATAKERSLLLRRQQLLSGLKRKVRANKSIMLEEQTFHIEVWGMKETTPAAMPPRSDRWCKRFDDVFTRQAQKREFRNYLGGLLGESSRKNLYQMASDAVGVTYHRLHHFLTEAP